MVGIISYKPIRDPQAALMCTVEKCPPTDSQGSDPYHSPLKLRGKVAMWSLGKSVLSGKGCHTVWKPESFSCILEGEDMFVPVNVAPWEEGDSGGQCVILASSMSSTHG